MSTMGEGVTLFVTCHIAQQPRVLTLVIETYVVLYCELFQRVANLVDRFGHQSALVNIDHFVEESRQVVCPCGVQLPPQDSQADGNGNPGERLREEV